MEQIFRQSIHVEPVVVKLAGAAAAILCALALNKRNPDPALLTKTAESLGMDQATVREAQQKLTTLGFWKTTPDGVMIDAVAYTSLITNSIGKVSLFPASELPTRIKRPSTPHHSLINHFVMRWEQSFKAKYEFRNGRDAAAAKALHKRFSRDDGTLDSARMDCFLRAYFRKTELSRFTDGHSLHGLHEKINDIAIEVSKNPKACGPRQPVTAGVTIFGDDGSLRRR